MCQNECCDPKLIMYQNEDCVCRKWPFLKVISIAANIFDTYFTIFAVGSAKILFGCK